MSGADKVLAVVGIGLHLFVGVFPYAASGLIAPLWGIAVLYVVWLGLLAVAVQLVRTRERVRFTPIVPVVAIAVWIAVISLGGAVLGWTA